ncbi:MAG: hypothetical protein ABR568_08835 [Pyrinomonadaceae bacterium]
MGRIAGKRWQTQCQSITLDKGAVLLAFTQYRDQIMDEVVKKVGL